MNISSKFKVYDLLSIIAGVVTGIIAHFGNPGNYGLSISIAAIGGGVTFMCLRFLEFTEGINGIQREMESQSKAISSLTVMKKLENMNELIRGIGENLLNHQLDSLKTGENSITVVSTDWAMFSNGYFWENLTKLAKREDSAFGRQSFVEAWVVFRGQPTLWLGTAANKSLMNQSEFHLTGKGQITRIIVGQCSLDSIIECLKENFSHFSPEPRLEDASEEMRQSKLYAHVIRLMHHAHVKVCYLQEISEEPTDFALVSPYPNVYVSMTWTYSGSKNRVVTSEFEEMARPDKKDEWDALKVRAFTFTEEQLTSNNWQTNGI